MTTALPTSTDVDLPLWRLHLLRAGYLILAAGLALVTLPEAILQDRPWTLLEGVVNCMLAALSLLAFLGLRHPLKMLPLLLFESAWKLIWLAFVAAPLLATGDLDPETRTVAAECLLVVIFLIVIPWRHVYATFVAARGDRWRG